MSDGSGIDFGTIRSRPLSPQGRDNWDLIFGRYVEMDEKMYADEFIQRNVDEVIAKKSSKDSFNPEDHEQLK